MFFIIEFLVFAALLAADQITKYLICPELIANGNMKVIPDILTFTYRENTGASFGMLSNVPWLVLALTITISAGLMIFMIVKPKANKLLRFSLAVLLAGAIGNIYDRLVFGYVRDFIDYTFLKTWFNINFAVCNVADIVLFIGCGLILIYAIFFYKGKPAVPHAVPSGKAKENAEAAIEEDHSMVDLSGSGPSFTDYDGGKKPVEEKGPKGIVKNESLARGEEEVVYVQRPKETGRTVEKSKTLGSPVKEEPAPAPVPAKAVKQSSPKMHTKSKKE